MNQSDFSDMLNLNLDYDKIFEKLNIESKKSSELMIKSIEL